MGGREQGERPRPDISSREIFEEFEPESEDEFEDAEDGEDRDDAALATSTKAVTLNDDDEEDKDEGTAVQTSHLRHFVIQVSTEHTRGRSHTSGRSDLAHTGAISHTPAI